MGAHQNMNLCDQDFWLALVLPPHEHHPVARAWWESLTTERALFCRSTQQGFLRLLTTAAVLEPYDLPREPRRRRGKSTASSRRLRPAVFCPSQRESTHCGNNSAPAPPRRRNSGWTPTLPRSPSKPTARSSPSTPASASSPPPACGSNSSPASNFSARPLPDLRRMRCLP